MTDRTLDSAAFFTITLLSSPSAPQFLLPFSGSFIPFLPPPEPIPYHPPSFNRRRCFSLSLHPCLPPPSHRGVERPSSWTAPLSVGLRRSSALFPPNEQPKEFLVRSCVCLPSSSCPPFAFLDFQNQVPVVPRFLLSRGTFLPLPASTIGVPDSPPCRPQLATQSPAGPGWWCCVILPPVPCDYASPSPCSAPSLDFF